MDRLGDELLTGTALAGDEHRRVRRRDLDDAPEHLADRLRAPGDVLELVPLLELAGEQLHLAREPPVMVRALDLDEELLLRERLLDVVEGAEPHRLDGALDGAVGRHHDDLGRHVRLLHRAEHADTIAAAHPEIGEHDVVSPASADIGPLTAVARFVDLVPGAAQHHRQRGAHVPLIIDDENLRHHCPPTRRRLTGSRAACHPRAPARACSFLGPARGDGRVARCSRWRVLPTGYLELLGEVSRLAELLDQADLHLQPVNVLLLRAQDLGEQRLGSVVA